VILEINTPGGRLDAVLQMRDALVSSPVRTIAFVNREAFSAGALVAIAAHEIYLAPGAVMGAATPVTGEGETADEKTISAVRKTFKSTAELRGRDPRVAEAMVDPALAIEGLVEAGELLTLTTTEALAWGYANGVAADRAELLRATGLADAPLREVEISLAERVVRFLTNPVVASLLFSLGILTLIGTAYSGEVGPLTGAGLGLLALFFWGHFLAGLAGWEGVALVVLGLALLALEVLVIPGFGVAGVLGIAALLGGLFLSVVGRVIVTREALERGAFTVVMTLVLLVAGTIVLLWSLPRMGQFRNLVLDATVGEPPVLSGGGAAALPARRRLLPWGGRDDDVAPVAAPEPAGQPSLVGARGLALSDLRPGGIARIGHERVDVVTQGDFVAAGETVEVIRDDGYRRVVRRLDPAEARTDDL
jgi:membrane-bound serine protease (ClpP class)